MKIITRVRTHDMELELDKIKSYKRFTLYQVSKVINGVKTPLWKECFTNLELRKILVNGYDVDDEINYDNMDAKVTRIIDGRDSEDETFEYLLADLLDG